MKIGIGSPAAVPWVKAPDILEWARLADSGPFSTIAIIDRLVFQNYDPLIALTAAAAVTRRIRLMTSVLLAPLRNTAILAKQAASLDALSGGRFTLGLGVGGRQDDYAAAQVPFEHRGTLLTKQVQRMKRIWSGQPAEEGLGIIGPMPARAGGPELLLGAYSEKAARRVGRLADGYISGGGIDVAQSRGLYQAALDSWQQAGRPGQPRYVGAFYVALGPQADIDAGQRYMDAYYGPGRPFFTSAQAIIERARAYADAGMDELILWAANPDPAQVQRIAEAAEKAQG